MASANNVAKYILSLVDEDEEELMSNLKLQKLLYYSQGFYLAMKETPLFPETIEAWAHGPVVPEVYHTYKENGAGGIPVPKDFDLTSLTSEEIVTILK